MPFSSPYSDVLDANIFMIEDDIDACVGCRQLAQSI
jgi:hypothetical protein